MFWSENKVLITYSPFKYNYPACQKALGATSKDESDQDTSIYAS